MFTPEIIKLFRKKKTQRKSHWSFNQIRTVRENDCKLEGCLPNRTCVINTEDNSTVQTGPISLTQKTTQLHISTDPNGPLYD